MFRSPFRKRHGTIREAINSSLALNKRAVLSKVVSLGLLLGSGPTMDEGIRQSDGPVRSEDNAALCAPEALENVRRVYAEMCVRFRVFLFLFVFYII